MLGSRIARGPKTVTNVLIYLKSRTEMEQMGMRDRLAKMGGEVLIEISAESLDRGAALLCTYDPEWHHPTDFVQSILEAMLAHPLSHGKA